MLLIDRYWTLYRLLLLIIALVGYGSLYPWQFHAVPLPANPLWMLLHSWPAHLNRFLVQDILVNVLLYVPLGAFGFLSFAERSRTFVAVSATLLLGLILSSAIEMTQLFDAGRVCSALDVTSDVMGSALGIGCGVLFRRTLLRKRILKRPDALLLACCWAAYQTFPFLPDPSRVHIIAKIRILDRFASLAPVEMLLYFAEVLALAALIQSLAGKGRLVLAAMLLLYPLRLIISGREITLIGTAGIAAGWMVASLLPLSMRVVAGILASAIVLNGLAPFQFHSMVNSFSWIPFQASLLSDWQLGMTVLLGKAFRYGALIWLITQSGYRLPLAAMAVAAVLGAIEAIQIFLPGRSSEITDPVLAVIVALAFWSLHGGYRIRNPVSTD